MSTDPSTALEVPSHRLIAWGAALGIGAGLIEAAMATIRSGRTALLVGRGGDFLWLAPLVGLVLGVSSVILMMELAGCLWRLPSGDPHHHQHRRFPKPGFSFPANASSCRAGAGARHRFSARILAHSAILTHRADALGASTRNVLLDRWRTGIGSC